MPIVSIIMPCYNCRDYVAAAIDSVLAQTFKDYELLIVDDCSTDGTYEYVQTLVMDKRINLVRLEKNSGPAAARNTAIEMAQSRFIAFLDSDDLWHPRKLEIQIAAMQSNNWKLTYTLYDLVDKDGVRTGDSGRLPADVDYASLLTACVIQNSTAVYDAVGLGRKVYCPPLRRRQDYGLLLDAIKGAGTAYLVHDDEAPFLCSYRLRPNSVSSQKMGNIPQQWRVYTEIERMHKVTASYYMCRWFIYAAKKNLFRYFSSRLA